MFKFFKFFSRSASTTVSVTPSTLESGTRSYSSADDRSPSGFFETIKGALFSLFSSSHSIARSQSSSSPASLSSSSTPFTSPDSLSSVELPIIQSPPLAHSPNPVLPPCLVPCRHLPPSSDMSPPSLTLPLTSISMKLTHTFDSQVASSSHEISPPTVDEPRPLPRSPTTPLLAIPRPVVQGTYKVNGALIEPVPFGLGAAVYESGSLRCVREIKNIQPSDKYRRVALAQSRSDIPLPEELHRLNDMTLHTSYCGNKRYTIWTPGKEGGTEIKRPSRATPTSLRTTILSSEVIHSTSREDVKARTQLYYEIFGIHRSTPLHQSKVQDWAKFYEEPEPEDPFYLEKYLKPTLVLPEHIAEVPRMLEPKTMADLLIESNRNESQAQVIPDTIDKKDRESKEIFQPNFGEPTEATMNRKRIFTNTLGLYECDEPIEGLSSSQFSATQLTIDATREQALAKLCAGYDNIDNSITQCSSTNAESITPKHESIDEAEPKSNQVVQLPSPEVLAWRKEALTKLCGGHLSDDKDIFDQYPSV